MIRPARIETTMAIEQLDDLREIHMRCTDTGTYARWLLTEAQGNTFVDVEFGMDPIGASKQALRQRSSASSTSAAGSTSRCGPRAGGGG